MESFLGVLDLTLEDGRMILVGAALFTLFVVLMKRSLFDPMLSLVEAREAASTGALEEASALEQRALELDRAREQKIAATRIELMKAKLEKISEAKKQGEAIIEDAQRSAKQIGERARQETLQKEGEIRRTLETERATLVESTINQVLGSSASTLSSGGGSHA